MMKKKKTFLKKLKLEKFKCYENATFSFKDICIIVGENNAGKSCLVEALRLIAIAAQDAQSRIYKPIPKEFNQHAILKGFDIKTEKLKIELKTAVYFYNDDFAKITAYFETSNRIEIFINKNGAYAVLYDGNNKNIVNKNQAKNVNYNIIGILPQISLIRENEKLLSETTIKGDKDTYLSSLHFRNEILLYKDKFFNEFKDLAEETWQGLKINKISYVYGVDDYINLMVTDNNFPAEVGFMGSGLQMWLQIIWFLVRSKNCEIVILDEPDVYMHADLQRKLLDIVKSKFSQIIIATHSIEIISRVEPDKIMAINKKDKKIKYASDSASVQLIVDQIGGMQNISLIRLGKARKCLFVEGDDDEKYLNWFNELIYGKRLDLPIIKYHGSANIPHIFGAAQLLYKESSGQIKCYAVGDKDYKREEEIDELVKNTEENKLNLHIWEKKEIENYLINPDVIFNLISTHISRNDFDIKLRKILDSMKDDVIDNYAQSIYEKQKKALKTCNEEARKYVNSKWNSIENKIAIVNGKDLIKNMRKEFTFTNDNLSFGKIMSNFTINDIATEIKELLKLLQ